MEKTQLVEHIGQSVMENALGDRKGYRHLWDDLDDELREEIIMHVGEEALKAIIGYVGYTLGLAKDVIIEAPTSFSKER